MATATYQLTITGERALQAVTDVLGAHEMIDPPKNLGPTEIIDGLKYRIFPNEKAKGGYSNHFVDSVKDDRGWRVAKTGESVAKLLTEVGVKLPEGVNNVSSRAGDYWKFASVFNVLDASREAVNACGEVWSKDVSYIPGEESHKVAKSYQKSFGAIAMWGYATTAVASCFSGIGGLIAHYALKTADTIDAGDKSMQLGFAHQTYNLATEKAKKAKTNEVKQCFTETANLAMIRAAQAICSIVGFMFGLMLILGSSFVPPVVAATVSVAGNFLAIWATIYAKSMEYGEAKFFDHEHVHRVTTA